MYKAEFEGGLVAAVKRMNKISEQAEDEFCREIELLARLHHRHLVALKGFCIEKQERFTHSRKYVYVFPIFPFCLLNFMVIRTCLWF
mgnify:CR=1 FL=1